MQFVKKKKKKNKNIYVRCYIINYASDFFYD